MALRKHKNFMREDVSTALSLISLQSGKRQADAFEVPPAKRQATDSKIKSSNESIAVVDDNDDASSKWVLKPAPYFYYTDRSCEVDDDPLTPLTPPGILPTFPAKMHSILANKELSSIIEWLPHGRAWRILNPRIFEIHVLPRYFHHNKLSSFIRQTNGWGFRRLTQGYDRNAYYHEYFLKDLPHLSKKMVRPKVAEKKAVDPDHEPDFYAISKEIPLPCVKSQSISSCVAMAAGVQNPFCL